MPIFIYQDVEAQNLEASRITMIGGDEAMVCILKVRLQGYNRLGCQIIYLAA